MDVAITEIENKRTYSKMASTVRPTSLKTKSPLEEQAFSSAIFFCFQKVQEEFE